MEKFVFLGKEHLRTEDQLLQATATSWTNLSEALIRDTQKVGSIIQDVIVQAGPQAWVAPAELALLEHAPDVFYAVEALRNALMKLEGKRAIWLQPHTPFELHDPLPDEILEGSYFTDTYEIIPNTDQPNTAHSYRVYDRKKGIIVATNAGFHIGEHSLGARITMSVDGKKQPTQQLGELQEISLIRD